MNNIETAKAALLQTADMIEECGTLYAISPHLRADLGIYAKRIREALAALDAAPEAVGCQGLPQHGCDYLAPCGVPCNKCGRVHNPLSFALAETRIPDARPIESWMQDKTAYENFGWNAYRDAMLRSSPCANQEHEEVRVRAVGPDGSVSAWTPPVCRLCGHPTGTPAHARTAQPRT